MDCSHCGTTFKGATQQRYCGSRCRASAAWSRRHAEGYLPPSRRTPCAGGCGKDVSRTPTSAAEPMCKPCRSQLPARSKWRACADCGIECWGMRCRECAGVARRIGPEDMVKARRYQRDGAAPGLSTHARALLLAKWKRQRRPCAYCDRLADTIDHVVPLVRGGTNYIGNLLPCCRSCNGSKGGKTVAEWRHGRKAGRTTTGTLAVIPRPSRVRKPKPVRWADAVPMLRPCVDCGSLHARHAETCADCATKRNRIQSRNRYRVRVGLAPTTDEWVRPRTTLVS